MKYALLAAAAALACVATSANASIIPTLDSVTDNLDGTWTWSYESTLSGDQGLTEGSKFVIFDFAGYVDGSIFSASADWATSTELLTLDLPFLPPDDPTLVNLVFTWVGADYNTSGGPFADTTFSPFGADSIFSISALDTFSAKAVKNNPPFETGTVTFNVGSVSVPAIPEPSTWLTMILGFAGMGSMLRVARRRGYSLA